MFSSKKVNMKRWSKVLTLILYKPILLEINWTTFFEFQNYFLQKSVNLILKKH